MERIVTPDLHNADRVVLWMGDEDLQSVATSAFWNDEKIEHEKAYNIQDGQSEKLLDTFGMRPHTMISVKPL